MSTIGCNFSVWGCVATLGQLSTCTCYRLPRSFQCKDKDICRGVEVIHLSIPSVVRHLISFETSCADHRELADCSYTKCYVVETINTCLCMNWHWFIIVELRIDYTDFGKELTHCIDLWSITALSKELSMTILSYIGLFCVLNWLFSKITINKSLALCFFVV